MSQYDKITLKAFTKGLVSHLNTRHGMCLTHSDGLDAVAAGLGHANRHEMEALYAPSVPKNAVMIPRGKLTRIKKTIHDVILGLEGTEPEDRASGHDLFLTLQELVELQCDLEGKPFEPQKSPYLYMEYKGVQIWHVYKYDDARCNPPRTYSYTTDLHGSEGYDDHEFDVRELDVPAAKKLEDHPPFMTGEVYDNADQATKIAWKERWRKWHDEGEPNTIREIIVQAIDAGLIATPDDD